MKKVAIFSDKAPKATSFFSQAILTATRFKLPLGSLVEIECVAENDRVSEEAHAKYDL